jgi:glycine/D-amino acid oxidase-like deaminating enzyme
MAALEPDRRDIELRREAQPVDAGGARSGAARPTAAAVDFGEVETEAVRIAIRPIPGDHLSAIGPMPRTSGYYIAITHSGATMSPFLGAAVADEILHGRQRAELAHFRPARFFN